MKSSSHSNSDLGLEMVPLDHLSAVPADPSWQAGPVPVLDLNSTDPLPTLDVQSNSPGTDFSAPFVPVTLPGNKQDSTTDSVWMDGDTLMCGCPHCEAPMSIRLWLMIADCWSCKSSMELTEELEREARKLWEQHQAVPTPGVRGKSTAPVPRKTRREVVVPAAGPTPKPTIAQARIRRQTQLQGTDIWVTNFFKDTPAWIISMIFHLVLLTLLGLFEVTDDSKNSITLSLTESRFVREGGTVMETDPRDEITMDVPVPEDVDLEDPEQREAVLQDIQEAKELREDFDAKNPNLPDLKDIKKDIRDANTNRPSLAARDPRVRVEMVKTEGGTTRTEAAVSRGLRWMSLHQNPDGSWSLNHRLSARCNCSHPGKIPSDSAATSLALLPFLGAGQTHQAGKYKKEVKRGLNWLLSVQRPDGDLRHQSKGNSGMYAHGQGAIVLCEAYTLTGDEKLKKPAQAAIDFIVTAQHPKGGWRYAPGQAGDTSVMGWQVMALHSARAAGLHVPDYTLRDARSYLDRAEWKRSGRFSYTPGQGPKYAMTAEGLLCRMYLGWGQEHERLNEGVNFLLKNHPPNKTFYLYYLYYASQVFHHVGGEQWEDWNFLMRESLVKSQDPKGHAVGSWTPRQAHDVDGGRLYMTSLAVCCLEVYYRHLPLFRKINLD
ncbi:MAG: prenyltransferase/squalene oxidase repeat-containing protein [Pirellulaceae bacterium]